MFKYNKLKIFIMMFFAVFFTIATITLSIEVGNNEPLVILFPVIPLGFIIYKNLKMNFIMSKYENAMYEKNYNKADEILTRYINKYHWLSLLKINLYLIKGENEKYIFYYNNFSNKLSNKRYRYYAFLLEFYKIIYDFLFDKDIDFTKINKIKNINKYFYFLELTEALRQYTFGNYLDAKNIIQKNIILTNNNDLIKYTNLFLIFQCENKLSEDTIQTLSLLKELAVNNYLKNHYENIIKSSHNSHSGQGMIIDK